MKGYYSVFKPDDTKFADCGAQRDAEMLVGMRGEGFYYKFTPYLGDIIDVGTKQLAGSYVYEPIDSNALPQEAAPIPDRLPESDAKPLDLA